MHPLLSSLPVILHHKLYVLPEWMQDVPAWAVGSFLQAVHLRDGQQRFEKSSFYPNYRMKGLCIMFKVLTAKTRRRKEFIAS